MKPDENTNTEQKYEFKQKYCCYIGVSLGAAQPKSPKPITQLDQPIFQTRNKYKDKYRCRGAESGTIPKSVELADISKQYSSFVQSPYIWFSVQKNVEGQC